MAQHQQSFQLPKIPVGRRVVSIAVQLKCGEREEDVDVIVYFCQWGTPKALRALWPVNTRCAPGLFQNLSLDTRTLCCSVGAKDCCSLYPKLECCCGVMLGRVCRRLETKAPAEVWSSPISLSSTSVELLNVLSRPLQFPYFILSILPIFPWSRSLLCCLQCAPHILCRICSAEQGQLDKHSTISGLLIAALRCPVVSLGVTKVPFVLLLSPENISFLLSNWDKTSNKAWSVGLSIEGLYWGRVPCVTSQRSVSAFLQFPVIPLLLK